MKIDENKSIYHEAEDAAEKFNRKELLNCRAVLRRLRYLEATTTEGGAYAEREAEALEWILTDVEFLTVRESVNQ